MYVCMYRNKAVATRPFDVGPSNFHTMTSLGSHVFFESFNEKGTKNLNSKNMVLAGFGTI